MTDREDPSTTLDTKPEIRHKSFRLTRPSDECDDEPAVHSARDAIAFSLVLQFGVFIISSLILDGGWMAKKAIIASVAYWAWTLMVMLRRASPDRTATWVLKWSYLILLAAVHLLWLVGLAISNTLAQID